MFVLRMLSVGTQVGFQNQEPLLYLSTSTHASSLAKQARCPPSSDIAEVGVCLKYNTEPKGVITIAVVISHCRRPDGTSEPEGGWTVTISVLILLDAKFGNIGTKAVVPLTRTSEPKV